MHENIGEKKKENNSEKKREANCYKLSVPFKIIADI